MLSHWISLWKWFSTHKSKASRIVDHFDEVTWSAPTKWRTQPRAYDNCNLIEPTKLWVSRIFEQPTAVIQLWKPPITNKNPNHAKPRLWRITQKPNRKFQLEKEQEKKQKRETHNKIKKKRKTIQKTKKKKKEKQKCIMRPSFLGFCLAGLALFGLCIFTGHEKEFPI